MDYDGYKAEEMLIKYFQHTIEQYGNDLYDSNISGYPLRFIGEYIMDNIVPNQNRPIDTQLPIDFEGFFFSNNMQNTKPTWYFGYVNRNNPEQSFYTELTQLSLKNKSFETIISEWRLAFWQRGSVPSVQTWSISYFWDITELVLNSDYALNMGRGYFINWPIELPKELI